MKMMFLVVWDWFFCLELNWVNYSLILIIYFLYGNVDNEYWWCNLENEDFFRRRRGILNSK